MKPPPCEASACVEGDIGVYCQCYIRKSDNEVRRTFVAKTQTRAVYSPFVVLFNCFTCTRLLLNDESEERGAENCNTKWFKWIIADKSWDVMGRVRTSVLFSV